MVDNSGLSKAAGSLPDPHQMKQWIATDNLTYKGENLR
jgi:hypothetical protein